MRIYIYYAIILIIILVSGLIYGILIYKNKVFPYKYIKSINDYLIEKITPYGPWSIGIYEGSSPFNLNDSENINNPVLTGKNITSLDASFVADPFIVVKNKKYTMFFEVLNKATNQGDIGYAESSDGLQWEFKKIIITEPFHQSYPYIFHWDNDDYLIPESGADLSVRLYRAVSFPDKWEYIGNLLSGHNYVDPSIFQHEDKWWLFASSGNDVLNLYYSEELLKGWKPHPQNPIIKFNKNIARPAGRVFTYNEQLYRLAQDANPSYGTQVFAFEITELTENSYKEKIASKTPIVTKKGKGWNAAGMHHVDLHKSGDRWIAAVDGRSE
ncbi:MULTISPECIES: glucosamine inositolphosphorylceramide transferase family protein [Psychrilyobacter]|uniref:Glucosamine inositolphosphorylceramide transferase 1 N-terminal domain-containing protein n=1 Tax=Psychrilyobacter piezotolerans TaxID=2293438 RepID=A0ABX9KFC4_9FUSO|nr:MULTISPECIES: hypothetical protein [Psychrilyobacter]MCS5423163.1 hypothetical protein [Psychrilyobacter sp. S5]NDI78557.1 hypothetical protein [Psychrilyobacter piezotolerans]RDE60262.1 hypothetical protein DV867_10950 [Psychrilyobacter sp. S5]REI40370.1 hypothetical protein DYH56_10950 [Psychrilyobacter piezotolerans]